MRASPDAQKPPLKKPGSSDGKPPERSRPTSKSARAKAFIEEWQTPIYRLAYQRLGNDADAWDATQEACIALLRDRPKLRDEAKLRPWVYQVASNVIRKQMRGLIRRRHREEKAEEQGAEDRVVEERERDALVRRKVAELPKKLESVIVLRYFHGLTEHEVAEALELPRSTVQYRVKKGLGSLKASLASAAAAVPLDQQLAALSWPAAPAALQASILTAAPGLVTAGATLVRAKVILALGITAFAFAGGFAVSQDPWWSTPAEPEAARVRRLRSEGEALRRALERARAEEAELTRALAKAAPDPTEAFLPGWRTKGEAELRRALADLGSERVDLIRAVLATGHEVRFDSALRLDKSSDSRSAPSLRSALLLKLGEINKAESVAALRAFLAGDAISARDIHACGLALTRATGSWNKHASIMIPALKRHLISRSRRPEDRALEAEGPGASPLAAMLRVYGFENFLAEAKQYALSGRALELEELVVSLPPDEVLAELSLLFRAAEPRLRSRVARAVVSIHSPEAYRFVLEAFAGLSPAGQASIAREAAEALSETRPRHRFRNPFTFESGSMDAPATRAELLRFCEALPPLITDPRAAVQKERRALVAAIKKAGGAPR